MYTRSAVKAFSIEIPWFASKPRSHPVRTSAGSQPSGTGRIQRMLDQRFPAPANELLGALEPSRGASSQNHASHTTMNLAFFIAVLIISGKRAPQTAA